MEKRLMVCSPMSLASYMQLCCSGKTPPPLSELLHRCDGDPALRAILCAAEILGAMEPVSATRPGACDPVIEYRRQIVVPVATSSDVPSEQLVAAFCSPQNRALVIDRARVTPANSVAAAQPRPQPVMKLAKLSPFDAMCLPFEPPPGTGAFVNIEHMILPPGGVGYQIYVQNWDPAAEAIYDFEARLWASC